MSNVLDEYNEQIEKLYNPEEKFDYIYKFAVQLKRKDVLHSLSLSEEANDIAFKNNYKDGIALSLFLIGRNYWVLCDYEKSIVNLMKALELSNELNKIKYQVDILNILGNVHFNLQNYDKSLDIYLKALKLAKDENYINMEATITNNIGEIYKELQDYDTALKYFKESKELYKNVAKDNFIAVPILNMGEIYYLINQYELSLKHIKASLSICKEINDKIIESQCLWHMGILYLKTGDRERALYYLKEGLENSRKIGDKIIQVKILFSLYELMTLINNKSVDLDYLYEALKMAEEINTKPLIAKACLYLAKFYKDEKNYKEALNYYKRYHDIEDETKNYFIEQRLKSLTTQYEIEKLHNENELYRIKNIVLKEKTEELEEKTKELKEAYDNIKIISEIGQSITSTLNLESVLDILYTNINSIMDINEFNIGIINKDLEKIEYKIRIENSKKMPLASISLKNKNSLAVWCINNKKAILLNDIDNDYKDYVENIIITGNQMQSLIYCPLIIADNILGILSVQSTRKNAYNTRNLDTLKALASYIAIAIKNAQESEKLSMEVVKRKDAQRRLEKLNEKLLKLSEIDGLTGVANRRYFDKYLNEKWIESKNKSKHISLIIIDIDCFKEYNDNYGHLAGDEAIKKVANSLKNSLQDEKHLLARYGGDEFVIIMPDSNMETVLKTAEKIKNGIKNLSIEHRYSDNKDYLTITIGVSSLLPNGSMSQYDLINNADKALYSGKKEGRDRISSKS